MSHFIAILALVASLFAHGFAHATETSSGVATGSSSQRSDLDDFLFGPTKATGGDSSNKSTPRVVTMQEVWSDEVWGCPESAKSPQHKLVNRALPMMRFDDEEFLLVMAHAHQAALACLKEREADIKKLKKK